MPLNATNNCLIVACTLGVTMKAARTSEGTSASDCGETGVSYLYSMGSFGCSLSGIDCKAPYLFPESNL